MTLNIRKVTNAVVAEAALPDGKAHVLFHPESTCGVPFDELSDKFDCLVEGRGDHYVKMIRH